MDQEEPKRRPDLTGMHPAYTWEAVVARGRARSGEAPLEEAAGDAPELSEVDRLRAEVARLRTALEDVVALALGDGEARQRSIVMQRRAIAALTGLDGEVPPRRPPPPPPPGGPGPG